MMSNFSRLFLFNLTILMLSACNLQVAVSDQTNSVPDSWIDKPLNGSHFPLGEIEIVAHGADLSGVNSLEMSINGSLFSTLSSDDPTQSIATYTDSWTPSQPGNYTLQVRAQNNAGGWGSSAQVTFTVEGDKPETDSDEIPIFPDGQPKPTETALPTPELEACSNRIQFAGETVPDNSVFAPETPFTKTWTLINSGSCTWNTGYQLVFFDGAAMEGSNIPLHKEVRPDENIVLSMNLIAASNEGTYQGWWMLQNEAGEFFGLGEEADAPFWVLIRVESPEQSPDDPPQPPPSGGSDTQLPVITSLTFSPGSPTSDDLITFDVTASDNVGVARIDIYFNLQGGGRSQPLHSCFNSTTCTFTGGLYAGGQYSYFAYAFDAAGNVIQSFVQSVQVITVVK